MVFKKRDFEYLVLCILGLSRKIKILHQRMPRVVRCKVFYLHTRCNCAFNALYIIDYNDS
jgi:hypothetical protein